MRLNFLRCSKKNYSLFVTIIRKVFDLLKTIICAIFSDLLLLTQ